MRVGNKNALVLIDADPNKSHIEVVGWRIVRDNSFEQIKNRALREGGQVLITQKGAAGLSALPERSVTKSKDTDSSSNPQGKIQEKDAGIKKFAPSERNKELKRISEEFADRQDQLEQELQKTRSDIWQAEMQKKGSRGKKRQEIEARIKDLNNQALELEKQIDEIKRKREEASDEWQF